MFRRVRRQVHQALALPSTTGAQALVHQAVTRWSAIQSSEPGVLADRPLDLARALASAHHIS